MDEVAAAIDQRPDRVPAASISRTARDIAVIKAAAEKSGWQTRPSPRKDQTGNRCPGRGIAYAQRNGTASR